ncbi:hypothetical protein CAC42_1044 [Sphaceloma murrayae]|uniref:Uncharacterized protein n=1 Tax=Sphaceloma murrayae TaxID=2082308 RepID=A0A2K1R1W8_9PEZI|nr:hypothetical protein CAC42_1044 [Sphaceloma murrayae]
MSPKRKRATFASTASTLSQTTDNSFVPSPPATNSPRTQCASEFQALEIQETPMAYRMGMEVVSDSDSPSASPRKRQRRSSSHNHTSSPTASPQKTLQIRPKEGLDRPRRISQPQLPSSPPLSPAEKGNKRIISPPRFSPTELPSTPNRTPITSPSKRPLVPVTCSQNPSSPSTNRSSSPAVSFWQPKEITGHVIDTSTPDDDGLGINGIGFQPTAAMAEARRSRRRQQISEWRAREAKEDRRRRFERRKGRGRAGAEVVEGRESIAGMDSGGSVGTTAEGLEGTGRMGERRVVRFVNVGGE